MLARQKILFHRLVQCDCDNLKILRNRANKLYNLVGSKAKLINTFTEKLSVLLAGLLLELTACSSVML